MLDAQGAEDRLDFGRIMDYCSQNEFNMVANAVRQRLVAKGGKATKRNSIGKGPEASTWGDVPF